MEHADVRVVDVDVVQVVQLLQHEVAGIEQDAAALLADAFMKRSKLVPSCRSSLGWIS
jgi:hypothetical protein